VCAKLTSFTKNETGIHLIPSNHFVIVPHVLSKRAIPCFVRSRSPSYVMMTRCLDNLPYNFACSPPRLSTCRGPRIAQKTKGAQRQSLHAADLEPRQPYVSFKRHCAFGGIHAFFSLAASSCSLAPSLTSKIFGPKNRQEKLSITVIRYCRYEYADGQQTVSPLVVTDRSTSNSSVPGLRSGFSPFLPQTPTKVDHCTPSSWFRLHWF